MRILKSLLVVFLCVAFIGIANADRIKDGTILYSAGHYLAGTPIEVGYDIFGYNYQAHMFNGLYANVYLGRHGFPPYEGDDTTYAQRLADEGYGNDPYGHWYWPYRNTQLSMKGNDEWISNEDNDGDAALDRHWGFPSYIGSGAWLTNHMSGSYEIEVNGSAVSYKFQISATSRCPVANRFLLGNYA